MSQYVNGAFAIIRQDDYGHASQRMRNSWGVLNADYFSRSTVIPASYTTPWWPGASDVTSGSAGDADIGGIGGQAASGATYYEQPEYTRGAQARYVFAGVTRDVNGAPLANCSVLLYRTSTREFVGETTSDANGAFYVTTPFYPDTHFEVMYKSDTPDVFGTSPNTLIGS